MNIEKFLRTPILKNICEQPLLELLLKYTGSEKQMMNTIFISVEYIQFQSCLIFQFEEIPTELFSNIVMKFLSFKFFIM